MKHVQIGDFKIISFGSGLPGKKSASPEGIKKSIDSKVRSPGL
jgi:hypothetical protein